MTEVDYEIAKLVLEETQLELREAKARIAELVAALKQVEWVSIAGCDHAMLECPWCGMLEYSAYPSGDHEPDCHRQLALERCKDVADKKGDGLEPTPPMLVFRDCG